MDIIDKIFNKLHKEPAPYSLKAKVLDIPSGKLAKPGHREFLTLFKFAAPAMVIVLLAGGFFYAKYWRVPQANAAFELVAEQTTNAGIDASSAFILKSSVKLSSYQVRQIVKFDPEVDFSVEDAGDKRYRITPKGALDENQIYKVAIAQGPADHDYSWAYQVKAQFQVISTIPGNRGNNVPPATGIEINLNRDGVVTPEQFFEISPSVAGTFEQHGSILLFRPSQPLAAGKVYTVTLKKGLPAKDSGETLANDYIFSFETELTEGNSNLVNFSVDFVDIVQKRPVFQVYAGEGTKAKGLVYKFDKPEDFIASYQGSDNWQYSWSYYNNARIPKNLDQMSVRKVLEYDVAFLGNGYNQYTEIPRDMDNGYYLLDVVAGTDHNYVWFQKTPLAHYASYSFDRSLVWLYDFAKKQPLKDVSVQLTDGGVLGATDGQGLAQFNTPKIFQDNNRQADTGGYITTPNVSVVKANGYNPYYIVQTNNYYSGIQEGSRYWESLSTDRPLYQLSDSIQFWGIVRPRDDIKTPEKVQISLYKGYAYGIYGRFGRSNNDSEPIVSSEVPVSDFSTYEGKLDFSGLTADMYTLVATQGDYVISSHQVDVTTFSKPSYQLSVTTDHKAYNTDQNIAFHVAAKFYDDTPVPNLVLNYTGAWGSGVTGIVTTNANGEATVNISLPYRPDTAGQQQYWPQSFYISFNPQKAEEGFISQGASVVIVGPKVSLDTDNKPAKDGTNTFTVTAHSVSTNLFETQNSRYYSPEYLQAPVLGGQKITANIKKTTYTTRQTGEYYDFIDKVNRPVFAYDKTEAIVETVSGITDKTGVWKFTRKYNYEPNVSYSLFFESADKDGKVARATSYYLFSDTPYSYGDYSNNPNALQPQLNLSNKLVYQPVNLGDSVQFNLQFSNATKAAESKPVKIMYYTYQRNILKTAVSDSLSYSDSFSQDMSPMVSYKAVVLGPIGFEESNPVDVYLDTKSVELKVDVTMDKEQYRPGDTVNATVKVRDSSGHPAKGSAYLSVVDEAVFAAAEYDQLVDTLASLYAYVIQPPAVSLTQYNNPGGDGGGGGGGPTLPRSKFQDTVVAKSLELDRNGEAKISFTLPHNLTSWRITTQAFDPKPVRAGSSTSNISTGLPLFADLSMSSVYVKGDEPLFRVRIFGKQYDAGKPAHVSVSSPGLSINYEQDIKGNIAYIPANALPTGQYPIEVKVRQGDLSDDLVRTVNVLDSSLTVPRTASYKLSEGTQGIAGNENGLTEIIATDNGRGKQFGLASMLAGQGGTRFDQRASSFYAQTILHDEYGLPNAPEKFDPSIFQVQKEGRPPLGLSLFSYGDTDLKVSALGAALIPEYLPKDNMVTYFNQSLQDTKADSHRISQSLLGLAAYNQPILTKLQLVKDDPAFDLEDKLFIANGLAIFGDKESARNFYYDSVKPKLVSDSGQLYLADADETRQAKLTALAGMLASQLNLADDRDQLVLYLNNHPAKKDTVSLEQAFIVKSSLAQAPKSSASFEYKTGKRSGSFELKSGNRFNLQLLPDELKSLQFSNVKGDIELLSWYNGPVDLSIKPNLDISLARDYSVNGKAGLAFKDGDLVKVTVTAQPKAGIGSSAVFQITDILPAGLRPITPSYYSGVTDTGPYLDPCNPIFTYPDIIDGNKISFTIQRFGPQTKCGASTTMRVIYYARVSGFGNFRADAPVLTSLEDPSQFTWGPAQLVKISQ